MTSDSPIHTSAAILLGLLVGLSQLFTGLTNDTKTLAYLSVQVLQSGDFYDRMVELNPPLIVLVYALPVWLFLHFPVPAHFALHGFAFLLCLSSVFTVRKLLMASNLEAPFRHWLLTSVIVALLIIPPLSYVFGDRDHLVLVLAMPWILSMLLGLAPPWYLSAIAGLGFSLKPQTLLCAAALLVLGGRLHPSFARRLLSSSSWPIGAVVGLSAFGVSVLFPTYLSEISPIVATTYASIGRSLLARAGSAAISSIVSIALILLGMSKSLFPRRAAWVALVLTMNFYYFLSGGWDYMMYVQQVPFVLICGAVIACRNALPSEERRRSSPPAFVAYAGIILIVVFASWRALAGLAVTRHTGYSPAYLRLPPSLEETLKAVAKEHFILLSMRLRSTTLADLRGHGPRPVFGYDYLWPLPWLIRNPSHPKADMVASSICRKFLQALDRSPPPVILNDRSPPCRGMPDVDILAMLRSDPAIQRATEMYSLVEVIDFCNLRWREFCKFEIWDVAATPSR